MTIIKTAKFLCLGTALLSSTGCGIASLPGGYSPAEKQVVADLNTSNYTPRSAEDRAAILTQDLFAQATFWSREYDLNPADLEAAINLASTLRRLGNPAKSIEVTQTTRALYPRDVDLMAELAAAHIANNDPKEAIPILDSALGQRPQMARLWSLKGAALDQFEQYAEARQHYSRALSIAPNDPSAIANVGLSFALEGDPKTAEIWLRRAANMPGASASVRQNLSLVLGLQNKYGEAEKWARRDLDETAAANNMSYLKTLRGGSTPPSSASMPQPRQTAPRQMAPQSMTKNFPPKTKIGQTQTAHPLAKYSQYGAQQMPSTKLSMAGDISKYEGGPTSSRDIALAAAKRSGYGQKRANQTRTGQPHAGQTLAGSPQTPKNLLGRISQKNTPKAAIARQQQQQLAQRFQQQRQMQQNQMQQTQMHQGQMQRGQMKQMQGAQVHRQTPPLNYRPQNAPPAGYAPTSNPYANPAMGYGHPQSQIQGQVQGQMPRQAYGNPQAMMPQNQAQTTARRPARQRRR